MPDISGENLKYNYLFFFVMTLNERLQMLDIEREVQLGNIIKVDDSNLRCTRGLLPFVLTILDGVGALTLSNQQVGSVFLQYGKKRFRICLHPRRCTFRTITGEFSNA